MSFQEKIVVDVRHPQNRQVMFRPLRRVLRTEVDSSKSKSLSSAHLRAVGGNVPGERLEVNFRTLKYRIIDCLTLPEHEQLAAAIKTVMRNDENAPENVYFADPVVGSFPAEESVTWLHHIRKQVDQKFFHLIEGKLPSLDEISKMGDVMRTYLGGSLPDKLIDKCCKIPKTAELVGAGK